MTAKQITIREGKVQINFFQEGQGDKTLLFLHGWCINGQYWKDQVAYFSRNYSVYVLDLPGFGSSKAERKDWTVEEYAGDVAAFMDRLDLRNVVLIGHSMAGEIILQVALSNNPRVAGIVGVDNFKMIDVVLAPEVLKQMNDFFPMLEADFSKAAPFYADLMLFHPATPENVRNRVKSDFANSNPVVGYDTCMKQMQFAYSDAQRLELLRYKLYLINSDGTPTYEEGLRAHCKSSFQVESISDTGHYPMVEKPADFNRLLDKVLAEME